VFLERFKENLVLDNWVDKKNVPLWRGKTVNYFAYYPFAGDATAITEGSSTANEVTIAGQTITATVAKYAQWAPFTEIIKLTARDKNLQGLSELFGEAAAKSLEEALAVELFTKGSIPIRVDELDNSSTYSYEGTVDASAATNSTTVLYDAALTGANNLYDGAHFATTYKSTKNYRHGSMVTDFSATNDLVTLTTAAPAIFTTGTTYRIVVGTGLAAVNKMTGTAIEYAVAKARENKFYTFPGGWFKSSLAPQVEYDLLANTVWRNIGQYQQAAMLEKWEIGKLWGVQFYRATMPYRESVAGVKNMTGGVVFSTPIMGQHALANVSLEGMREHKILIKTPGPQSTNEPYDEKGTIGYKFYAAPKSLNAAFCINLMSGATGVV
jgi:N4-gp56 family major capsid protein